MADKKHITVVSQVSPCDSDSSKKVDEFDFAEKIFDSSTTTSSTNTKSKKSGKSLKKSNDLDRVSARPSPDTFSSKDSGGDNSSTASYTPDRPVTGIYSTVAASTSAARSNTNISNNSGNGRPTTSTKDNLTEMCAMMSVLSQTITGSFNQMIAIQKEMKTDQNCMMKKIAGHYNDVSDSDVDMSDQPITNMAAVDYNNDGNSADEMDVCDQIDNVLNDSEPSTRKKDNSDSNSKKASNDNEGEFGLGLLDEIIEQYAEDTDRGPAISESVAKVINSLLQRKIPDDKISKTEKQYKVPANCEMLVMPRVNTEIWNIIGSEIRSLDLKLQKIQSRLTKGLIPIALLINDLNEKRRDNATLKSEELQTVIRKLFDSVALLASSHFELSMRRREVMKPDLNSSVHSQLCNTSSSKIKITTNLFGDDLPQSLKDIREVNNVGQKLLKPNKNNYRYKPYNNNNNNNFSKQRGFQHRSPLSRGSYFNQNSGNRSTTNNNSKNWSGKKSNQTRKKSFNSNHQ